MVTCIVTLARRHGCIGCTCNVTLRWVGVNSVYRGKAISIKCSQCMSVALAVRLAVRMRHIMLPVWLYHTFRHYLISNEGAIFGGK
jgi:hypothetical protein